MRLLKQFARILLITFVSEALRALIPLPVPAGVYGIALLFILLQTKILPLEKVEGAGKLLIEIMPVMFIPAAVGALEAWDVIAPSLGVYLALTLVSTVAVMGASGRVAQALARRDTGEQA